MAYYTRKIPTDLAQELFDMGMTMKTKGIFRPFITLSLIFSDNWNNKFKMPTYAEVFDWLIDNGYHVLIEPRKVGGKDYDFYQGLVRDANTLHKVTLCEFWEEAANDSIGLCIKWLKDLKK